MPTKSGTGNLQDELNRMAPAASHAKLGDLLVDMITKHNSLVSTLTIPNFIISPATLVIKAGSSAVVKSSAAITAVVGGVVVVKAANTDMSALVGTLATAKSALWAFYVDAAGTITTSTKTTDADTAAEALALMPATPAGTVRLGHAIISNATGSNFVGGTTALDTASLTVAYTNEANPVSAYAVAALSSR